MRTDIEQARRDALMEAHTAIFKAFRQTPNERTNSAVTSFQQNGLGPGVQASLRIISALIDGSDDPRA